MVDKMDAGKVGSMAVEMVVLKVFARVEKTVGWSAAVLVIVLVWQLESTLAERYDCMMGQQLGCM